MTDGRTSWWPKDAAWWRRERVVMLGLKFGADGPAVLDYLSGEAQAQRAGGKVREGYLSVARGCFVGPELVPDIVDYAAEIGALDDFARRELTFECRISGWQADQARGRATQRKATSRNDLALDRDEIENCHGESRPGANLPARASRVDQTRTEQNNTNVNTEVELPLDGAPDERAALGERETVERLDDAKLRLRREVVQRLFDRWVSQCGKNGQKTKFTRDRRRKIEARLKEGYSEQDIATAIDGAARAAYVSDDGRRHDDLELICRNGSKLESFIDRAKGTAEASGF